MLLLTFLVFSFKVVHRMIHQPDQDQRSAINNSAHPLPFEPFSISTTDLRTHSSPFFTSLIKHVYFLIQLDLLSFTMAKFSDFNDYNGYIDSERPSSGLCSGIIATEDKTKAARVVASKDRICHNCKINVTTLWQVLWLSSLNFVSACFPNLIFIGMAHYFFSCFFLYYPFFSIQNFSTLIS